MMRLVFSDEGIIGNSRPASRTIGIGTSDENRIEKGKKKKKIKGQKNPYEVRTKVKKA